MRVGTSGLYTVVVTTKEDHPHACGDKQQQLVVFIIALGSSPCVWGQDAPFGGFGYCFRIIPMRVGTRFFALPRRHLKQDHPHACGDKY